MGVRKIPPKKYKYTNNGKPPVKVSTIRKLLEEGYSVAEVAEKTGISRQAVYQKIKADDAKKEAKNTTGYRTANMRKVAATALDPETGLVVSLSGNNKAIIAKMGDDSVSEFVAYHMAMLQMRQGVDKKNVNDLYQRFYKYLEYCCEHNIVPNNMNAYFAIGVARQDISAWHTGVRGTAEHKEFADTIMAFFASVHEQGATDGVLNPISAIFWQKAHDGLSDQPKIEVSVNDPLGDKRTAEDIAEKYSEVELPD